MGIFFKKDKDKDLKRNYRRYYMRGKLDRRTLVKLFSASVIGAINDIEEEINYIKGQPEESFRHTQELDEYLEDKNINKDDSLNVLYLKTLVGRINDGFTEQQNMIRLLCNTRSGLLLTISISLSLMKNLELTILFVPFWMKHLQTMRPVLIWIQIIWISNVLNMASLPMR